MRRSIVHFFILIALLISYIFITGCSTQSVNSKESSTPAGHSINNGYWCRTEQWMVNYKLQNVTKCYQFFSDGTYAKGHRESTGEGIPMRKIWSDNGWLTWRTNSQGQYEISDEVFTYYGDRLESSYHPDFGPYLWSPTGV